MRLLHIGMMICLRVFSAAMNSLFHSVNWLSDRTNIIGCGLSEVVHIVSRCSTGSSADCVRRTYDSHTGCLSPECCQCVTNIHGSLVLILLSATTSSATSQDRAGSLDQVLQSAELLLPQRTPHIGWLPPPWW